MDKRKRIVADNIRRYRNERGWSQETLGEKANVSHSFINQLENCKRDMTLEYCNRICTALDVSPNDLLEEQRPCNIQESHIQRFIHITQGMNEFEIYFLLESLESLKKTMQRLLAMREK